MVVDLQEVVEQPAQNEQLGVAVGYGIHKGAELTGFAAQTRHRAIQRIEGRAYQHEQAAQHHVASAPEPAPAMLPSRPEHGHHVGGDAQPVQESADGVENAFEQAAHDFGKRLGLRSGGCFFHESKTVPFV